MLFIKFYIYFPILNLLSVIRFLLLLFGFLLLSTVLNAQIKDTIKPATDTTYIESDSITVKDTLKKNANENALKSKIKYTAKDSIVVFIKDEKIHLYGDAEINYEKINIKAAYIEVDFNKTLVYASGSKDSTGKIVGKPEFKEEAESFTADNMTYNYKTKKGIVRHIFTKEGEGYLHGNIVKKLADNITFINSGAYTTCDLADPHYEIKFIKAKVIPDNKIVSGPALLFVEGIPIPIGVPFGYFPISQGRRSGVIVPAYGESSNRGFYLENGGYYFAINDNLDATLKADIYSLGGWALKTSSDYDWLYHSSGNLSLDYGETIIGDPGQPGYTNSSNFFFRWKHDRSDKASPNSRFQANVNFGSLKYNQYNLTPTSDYLTNTFQSSVSYSTTLNDKYNLSVDLSHNQNSLTKNMDIVFPQLTFSANRIYLFQKKEVEGTPKWYENISINYLMDSRNELTGPDSLLFKGNILKKMNNGIQHTIPISSSNKLFKHFTWSNSLNYNERWYFNSIRKDTLNKAVKVDTIGGFQTERDFNYNSSISTKLYGMYQFKNGYIRAIRHVITPSIGFYYTPFFKNYFRYYTDPTTKTRTQYSIFDNGIYGTAPTAKSGAINFAISNNLEMKVRSKKDTVTGMKKIILIEDFTIAESYDLAKDSMQWSPLTMSGHTKLFKNVDLKYNSEWDPYVSNEFGRQNRTEWDVNHQLYNMQNSQWALSINYNISSKSNNKQQSTQSNAGTYTQQNQLQNPNQKQNIVINPNGDGYVDFDVPWNLNVYYTFMWTSAFTAATEKNQKTLVQTLSFNGDVNLTKKWKIGFTSGYDFEHHDFSYTSVNIYRDLHCWEMIFNWIPMGQHKSYNFTIRVKAKMLQDLKLIKKTDWRDAQY